ncbi:MAG: hypothetical protein U0892_02905 [Pirellulales bacterium]
MNKAFLREPESDGRAYCPACGSLGDPVQRACLDHHIRSEARSRMGNEGWFCPYAECETVYFDEYLRTVSSAELQQPVYPKSLDAPICGCFGFTLEELDAAVVERSPTAIRDVLAKSKTPAADCARLAAGGKCCVGELQKLYIRGINAD